MFFYVGIISNLKNLFFSDQLHKIMEEKMSNFSIQKKEKTDEEKKLKGKNCFGSEGT